METGCGEKPNIYVVVLQPSNTMEEVEMAGEMKLDSVWIRTWWKKNHDWNVDTERYAI